MDIFTSSVSSKTFPFESHDNTGVYGDASFSSYLNRKDDDFIRKLSDSTPYRHVPNIISTAASPRKLLGGRNGTEDGEIGVFRAERYFNGGMDDDEAGTQKSTTIGPRNPAADTNIVDKLILSHHIDDQTSKPKLCVGTPSVGSESTTTNSQSALLQSFLKPTVAAAVTTTSPTTTTHNNYANSNYSVKKTKSFLSALCHCKCYSCKDNNSVSVGVNELDVGEISFSNAATKLQSIKCEASSGSFRESHFTFPTEPAVEVVHFPEETEMERKSLEVFGSPVMARYRNKYCFSLEKRLAMLSWDHTAAAGPGGIHCDDEINSDCSSDLFEIESLTNKANTFLPTMCYAPSEASVDWSVITASAADFEERRPSTATITSPGRVVATVNKANLKVSVNKEVQKRRSSGGLLGCNSQKAVKVAGDAHKSLSLEQPMGRWKSESSAPVPVKRVEEDTKAVGGFSFRSQGASHRALATLSLPRPYSPRLSNISFSIE